jgi:ParB-like chromosome segregation protein Spo0J
LDELGNREKVLVINALRLAIHEKSPFQSEPVDCVLWVPSSFVEANDYNPNVVAPPEMKLLERSIQQDGYTQPIVSWAMSEEHRYQVVDGFHRNRVGKESDIVKERTHGYLPLTVINSGREGRENRIAATIRHNRARGKHQVEAMSDIVIELKRRNWSDTRIGKELGMDPDEVLRLCQITGLVEVFTDDGFSKAWDIGVFDDDVGEILEDGAVGVEEEP